MRARDRAGERESGSARAVEGGRECGRGRESEG